MEVVQGDLVECALSGRFDLIFALVSTFHLLHSAAKQSAAFAHLAAHLQPGATLLLECFNTIEGQADGRLQQFSHRIETLRGPRDYVVSEFASTPRERDTMAAAAGLRLAARWSDWQRRSRVGAHSHNSLYQLR